MANLAHLLPDDAAQIHISRAWKIIGQRVSAIPDVEYPFDPAVVKAIHEFDPNVIPLFVRRAYQASTGEVRLFGFHAIASHRPTPKLQPGEWTRHVLFPAAGPLWRRPTHMDMHILDGRRPKGGYFPGKGRYLPFSWNVYELLRSMYNEWNLKQIQAYQATVEAKSERIRLAAEERGDVQARDRHLDGHMANITKADLLEFAAKSGEKKPTVVVAKPKESE